MYLRRERPHPMIEYAGGVGVSLKVVEEAGLMSELERTFAARRRLMQCSPRVPAELSTTHAREVTQRVGHIRTQLIREAGQSKPRWRVCLREYPDGGERPHDPK